MTFCMNYGCFPSLQAFENACHRCTESIILNTNAMNLVSLNMAFRAFENKVIQSQFSFVRTVGDVVTLPFWELLASETSELTVPKKWKNAASTTV